MNAKYLSLFLITLFLIHSKSFANEEKTGIKGIDCVAELMSKPSCINRLNAEKICKKFGPTKDTVDYIQKCVVDEGFVAGTEIMAPKNIMVICLGGQIFGSNKPKDNETHCIKEDSLKTLGISDSTLPKTIELEKRRKGEDSKVINK